MPSSKNPGDSSYKTMEQKLTDTTCTIKTSGFCSTNHFIQAHYGSEYAAQSLWHQSGKSYGSAQLIDLWMKYVLSGSKLKLNLTITQKATEIIVKESTMGYQHPEFQLSSFRLDIPYLTTEFGLKKIQDTYATLLPCLSFLLHGLLTAKNKYKWRNNHEKKKKTEISQKMSCMLSLPCPDFWKLLQLIVVIISMLLFFRNRAINAFQIIFRVFLASASTSQQIINTFNYMRISVSYQYVFSFITITELTLA